MKKSKKYSNIIKQSIDEDEHTLKMIEPVKHNHHFLNLCPEHLSAIYNTKYDAYYCPVCLKWLEDKCGDPNCSFCKERLKIPNNEQISYQQKIEIKKSKQFKLSNLPNIVWKVFSHKKEK